MSAVRNFAVFGEPVEVLVSGEMTKGVSATMMQMSPPGGGPPPHMHQNEDETFFVVEGEYEFLAGDGWTRRSAGQSFYAARGSVHTFRNAGSAEGKLLVMATPAGLDTYLEEISVLSIPQDVPKLIAISERYGISFPSLSA
ncbi:MAG TPA: cupin domain-containing protein [Acidobacteriaceae bacterium]|nr:cupin domain-containing protein [Acidobacteriaceae bacterium]